MLTETEQKRVDYYSDAEVIFGAHKVNDIFSLMSFFGDIYSFVPVIPEFIEFGVRMYQAFHFSGAFVESLSYAAEQWLVDYVADNPIYDQVKLFGWYSTLISVVTTITQNVVPPKLNDVQIYQKVAAKEYVAHCILDDGSDVTLKQILENNLKII